MVLSSCHGLAEDAVDVRPTDSTESSIEVSEQEGSGCRSEPAAPSLLLWGPDTSTDVFRRGDEPFIFGIENLVDEEAELTFESSVVSSAQLSTSRGPLGGIDPLSTVTFGVTPEQLGLSADRLGFAGAIQLRVKAAYRNSYEMESDAVVVFFYPDGDGWRLQNDAALTSASSGPCPGALTEEACRAQRDIMAQEKPGASFSGVVHVSAALDAEAGRPMPDGEPDPDSGT